MGLRKNGLMRLRFGECPGKKCGECSNLIECMYDKKYFKCRHYSLSSSEASDWRKKWPACGLFDKEYNGLDGVWFVKHAPRPKDEIPECEGQIEWNI